MIKGNSILVATPSIGILPICFIRFSLLIFLYFRLCSYTSIGSVHDTVPNALLCIRNSSSSEENFRPAYLLSDGRLERAGRINKFSSSVCGKSPALSNGVIGVDLHKNSLLTASAIAVGDEILYVPFLHALLMSKMAIRVKKCLKSLPSYFKFQSTESLMFYLSVP